MNRIRGLVLVSLTATSALLLTACSMDTVIWGPDGARIIDTTDQLVQNVEAGEQDLGACADVDLEIGDPQRWAGLSAGEPERLTGEYWKEQHAAGATWTINLEGLDTATAENGGRYPSYVFYNGDDDQPCVIDIEWGTVTF